MNIIKRAVVFSIFILALPGYSQQTKTEAPVDNPAQKTGSAKVKLNLQEIIRGIVARNQDVKIAVLDFSDADTDKSKFLGQYDVYSYGKAFSTYRQLSEENPAIANEGYRVGQTGVETGLQKSFSSGTTLQAGVNTLHQEITTPVTGAGMVKVKGYSSTVAASLSQELLKNAFGINDRRTEKSLQKSTEIKQRAAKQAISNTVMNSFITYWNYIIADENLKTANIAYMNTKDIRDLVRRKSAVGISEKEELLDWEGRLLQAKNGEDGASVGYINAKLSILRALNMDRSADIEIVQDLNSTAPDVTLESALREALAKRTDLINLKSALEISEMDYSSAKSNSLPSLKANAGLGYNDYNKTNLPGSFNTYNKQWNLSVVMSSPLGGIADEANINSSRRTLQKRKIELEQLEDGIKDEILIRIEQCSAAYKIYTQTLQSRDYAKAYYDQVLRKFSQGRYETTQLKLAFDNYISLRNSTLKSLVDYNICLIQLDISKNTVFDKYSIDIDAIISNYSKQEK